MKRILLLATVAALMAAMLMVGAASTFAHDVSCTGNNPQLLRPADPKPPEAVAKDRDGDGFVCRYTNQKTGADRYRDDHAEPL